MRKTIVIGAALVSGFVQACGGASSENASSSSDAINSCPSGATVEGVDVSEFQGDIDWNAVKSSGRAFAFVRVADGFYFDPKFDQNWQNTQTAGVLRGAYQFFRPGSDGTAQANFLLQHVAGGDLPPVLDVEVTDGESSGTIIAGIGAWVARVTQATGKKPIVYTAPGFWAGLGAAPSFGTDLWVAHWFTQCPSLPSSWGDWRFWQTVDNGSVPGIGGAVDLDVFNGSLGDLQAYGGVSPTVSSHRLSAGAAGRNADGRLEAFIVGADGELWHDWQTSPGGAWAGLAPMQGNITDTPAVGRNADGRLEVFVRGSDGELWHQWQVVPNGGWSGFHPMQGNMTGSPAVASDADGRLEVFVRGSDGQLWHQWQFVPNGGWSGFVPMTGNMTDSPAVVANADGRLEVFVHGGDGQLWHQWQVKPGGAWTGSFAPMTGNTTDSPAVARNSDGRLEAFVRGSDGQVWHQAQVAPNGGWTGSFAPLTGNTLDSPTVIANADGRLELFVRGSDGQMWSQAQITPSGAWTKAFAALKGNITDAPFVASNADGRIEAFARGSDWGLWHGWQTAPNTGWMTFQPMGGQLAP